MVNKSFLYAGLGVVLAAAIIGGIVLLFSYADLGVGGDSSPVAQNSNGNAKIQDCVLPSEPSSAPPPQVFNISGCLISRFENGVIVETRGGNLSNVGQVVRQEARFNSETRIIIDSNIYSASEGFDRLKENSLISLESPVNIRDRTTFPVSTIRIIER